jgi:soluble lytic murein transglycosylase-like protein
LARRLSAGRLALVARDIANGFMSTSRLIVTLVGCFTLVVGAVVLAQADLRERLANGASTLIAEWTAPAPSAAEAGALVAAEADGESVSPSSAEAAPEQKYVTRYLSRRYRVADEAVRVLVAAAFQAGADLRLDPLLILAVMAVESSMNPFAESSMGAQGLMQVMTRVHTERFEAHGGEGAALDPVANIKVGSEILKDLIRRGGSVERGLQLYVGAGNLPDDGGYASRVLAERARIELAASGRVDLALNAGWRADNARATTHPVSLAPATEPEPVNKAPEEPAPRPNA